jgi:hypothetical protein
MMPLIWVHVIVKKMYAMVKQMHFNVLTLLIDQ